MAIAWQKTFAHIEGIQVHWTRSVILFTAVWLGYAGDRWFDVGDVNRPLSERHDWYKNRVKFVFIIWLSVLITAVVFSFNVLQPSELIRGGWLTAGSILYTVFAQKGRLLKDYVHAKNFFISILITASSVLFVFESMAVDLFTIAPLVISSALFFVNCQYIRTWESSSSPTGLYYTSFTILLACIASFLWIPKITSLALACALSIMALGALDFVHKKIGPTLTRTLADIALLSPFTVIPFV